MSAFLTLLYVRFKPYFKQTLAVFITIVVLYVTYFAYKRFYIPAKESKNGKLRKSGNQDITIMMFHVDWCPHCRRALPEWKTFSDEYNKKQVNGHKIVCVDYDCTNDSHAVNKDVIEKLINKHDIKQYPTVFALVPQPGGTEMRVDYDAKVSKDNLEKFVVNISSDYINT
jgi:thiol-disulfide isomerase/thioredoxin